MVMKMFLAVCVCALVLLAQTNARNIPSASGDENGVTISDKTPNGGANVKDEKNFIAYGGVGGFAGVGGVAGVLPALGGAGGVGGLGGLGGASGLPVPGVGGLGGASGIGGGVGGLGGAGLGGVGGGIGAVKGGGIVYGMVKTPDVDQYGRAASEPLFGSHPTISQSVVESTTCDQWNDENRLQYKETIGADPDAWLFAIQEYFTLLNTPADQRLRIVGFNLEGATAEWFLWMSQNALITDWDRFVENVRDRFGPSKFEVPQGALSKLLQLVLQILEDWQENQEEHISTTITKNCFSILNVKEAGNTKSPLFADTFGNSGVDKSETSGPETPAKEVVDNSNGSALICLVGYGTGNEVVTGLSEEFRE
ncbi:hypothetical protein Tco_0459249 [Tanacetum coccineum]